VVFSAAVTLPSYFDFAVSAHTTTMLRYGRFNNRESVHYVGIRVNEIQDDGRAVRKSFTAQYLSRDAVFADAGNRFAALIKELPEYSGKQYDVSSVRFHFLQGPMDSKQLCGCTGIPMAYGKHTARLMHGSRM